MQYPSLFATCHQLKNWSTQLLAVFNKLFQEWWKKSISAFNRKKEPIIVKNAKKKIVQYPSFFPTCHRLKTWFFYLWRSIISSFRNHQENFDVSSQSQELANFLQNREKSRKTGQKLIELIPRPTEIDKAATRTHIYVSTLLSPWWLPALSARLHLLMIRELRSTEFVPYKNFEPTHTRDDFLLKAAVALAASPTCLETNLETKPLLVPNLMIF